MRGHAALRKQCIEALTPREREIVRLLVSGYTVAEIAYCLGRHQSTIYAHIERVRQRLGIHTEAQIGVFAVCAGLIDCQADNTATSRVIKRS